MIDGSTSLARFAELYADSLDPWLTTTSWYEERKRAVALACLSRPRYRFGVEPACGTGELTAGLAARCEWLVASDGVDAAVRVARRRTQEYHHVDLCRRVLPEQFPCEPGRANLVVLSEILYYFDEQDFDAVVNGSVRTLERAGDLLAVHWRPRAEDAPTDGDTVHRRLRARPELDVVTTHRDRDFLVDVLRLR